MNKNLEKIRKRSIEIFKDYPQKRETLTSELKAAQDELTRARDAQDNAEDLEGFNKAAEDVRAAEARTKFIEKAIRKLDDQPRMKESEYLETLGICRQCMDQAIDTYRKKTEALMEQLRTATEEYQEAAKEINGTLIDMDSAANVLQTKYPYRGSGSSRRRDRRAWEKYALRYSPADARRLAIECTVKEKPHYQWDSLLTAAWSAVERAYPRRNF